MKTPTSKVEALREELSHIQGYCMYCDEPYRNEPFKIGYAERVRSILFPWKYVHKVPEIVIESNLVGSWPVTVYHRERCTK